MGIIEQIIFDKDRIAPFLRTQIGLDTHINCCYGILDKKLDLIIAACALTNLTPRNVHINIAGREALSRRCLKINADLVFNQLGCRRLTALTDPTTKMHIMMRRLGFEPEGKLRDYYQNGNPAMVWGMLKEECRWF